MTRSTNVEAHTGRARPCAATAAGSRTEISMQAAMVKELLQIKRAELGQNCLSGGRRQVTLLKTLGDAKATWVLGILGKNCNKLGKACCGTHQLKPCRADPLLGSHVVLHLQDTIRPNLFTQGSTRDSTSKTAKLNSQAAHVSKLGSPPPAMAELAGLDHLHMSSRAIAGRNCCTRNTGWDVQVGQREESRSSEEPTPS